MRSKVGKVPVRPRGRREVIRPNRVPPAPDLPLPMTSAQKTYRPVDVPGLFEHQLDPALFTGDRLDTLCQEAARRGTLKVQFADPGRQRYGNDPIYSSPSYPIL